MSRADLSDEYVANLLKKDAESSSIKYSAVGSQAFMPKRPTSAAPKLNTRFLRNLIRETDSHNTALLAKERRDAREREFARKEATLKPQSRRRSRDRGRKDINLDKHEERDRKRRFQEGDDKVDTRPMKYNRHGDPTVSRQSGSKTRSECRSRSRSPRRSRRQDERSKYRRSRRHDVSSDGSDDSRKRSHRRNGGASEDNAGSCEHRNKSHQTERMQDQTCETDKPSRRRTRPRLATRSPSEEAIHRERKERRTRQDLHIDRPRNETDTGRPKTSDVPSIGIEQVDYDRIATAGYSDSDPLEALLGPVPPPREPQVQSRGRGAFTKSSGAIDNHFSSTYNASLDVQPDPNTEDDWDQALEALRDRQKWKQQGLERLRSAGFSEAELKRWEKGGDKDESDVRWAKKGEGREWDRGKVVDDLGAVEVKAAWASTQNESFGRLGRDGFE